jgi:hypothetical protein
VVDPVSELAPWVSRRRFCSEGLPGAGEPLRCQAPPDRSRHEDGNQTNQTVDQHVVLFGLSRHLSDFSHEFNAPDCSLEHQVNVVHR